MITLELPWPSSKLSPNARIHYQEKAKLAREAREYGYWIAKENDSTIENVPLLLDYSFHPPDNRRRDDDNFTAMMKNYRDGIFDALGQDDSLVQVSIIRKKEQIENGKVILKIIKLKNVQLTDFG